MLIKVASKVSILFVLFLFMSCKEDFSSISPIPSLKSEGVQVYKASSRVGDSLIVLRYSFEDGDGDIGYAEDDLFAPANFLVTFYEIENGEKKPYLIGGLDTLTFNERMPNITPTGKEKSIKAQFEVYIPVPIFLGYTPDSVMFESRIIDRAMNSSNSVATEGIKLNY
jgi:hypothetical protein